MSEGNEVTHQLVVLRRVENANIDIVLVHELTESSDVAWRSEDPSSCWPAQLPTGDFNNARVISFSYSYNGLKSLSDLIDPGKLRECAEALLRHYPLNPGLAISTIQKIKIDIYGYFAMEPMPSNYLRIAPEWPALPDFRVVGADQCHFGMTRIKAGSIGFINYRTTLSEQVGKLLQETTNTMVPSDTPAQEEIPEEPQQREPSSKTKSFSSRAGVSQTVQSPDPKAKRALLIGSSFKHPFELPGTLNDVETMARTLKKYGFDVENERYRELADNTVKDDVVVVYYSGHGGIIPQNPDDNSEQRLEHQFLVLYDFDPDQETWTGVFESEISQIMKDITQKTKNITFILDCCYNAPPEYASVDGRRAKSLRLSEADYSKISSHASMEHSVVRITAAAKDGIAWGTNDGHPPAGVLTSNIAPLMNNPSLDLTWRTLLFEVVVNLDLNLEPNDVKTQTPVCTGPDDRVVFSDRPRSSPILVAAIRPHYVVIRADKAHGIFPRDRFKLQPMEYIRVERKITEDSSFGHECKVLQVGGFKAVLTTPSNGTLPRSLAFAFLTKRSHRWPIRFPSSPSNTNGFLDGSGYFKDVQGDEKPLAEFVETNDKVKIKSETIELGRLSLSRKLSCEDAIAGLFARADTFARAHHLLSLNNNGEDDHLPYSMEFEIGEEVDGKRIKLLSGNTHVQLSCSHNLSLR
ncbi:hypothetical protein SNK05_010794 [Fusarium graminearum]|nr:hypothetical protein FG05_04840 [Fusarium graminearum]CAF3536553.1 unnamed protein product [Fusarium graminearum]